MVKVPPSDPPKVEQRKYRRRLACVPAAVRLYDHAAGQPISEWMHAVVRDVSAGGLRIELAGHAGAVFRDSRPGVHGVEVRPLPAKPGELLLCELRWSRPGDEPQSWQVGVRFANVDEARASLLVKRLQARANRRSYRGVQLLAAALTIALAAVAWMGNARQAELVTEAAQCARDLQDVSTRLDKIAGELQDVEGKRDQAAAELTKCQELGQRAAAAHADAVKRSGHTRKVKVRLDAKAQGDGESLDAGNFEFASTSFSGALHSSGVSPEAQLLLRVEGDGDERVDCEPSPVTVSRAASGGFQCPLPAGDGDIVLHISRVEAQ